MQIVYCEGCGFRIPASQIETGAVTQKDGKFLCEKCAPATVAVEPQKPSGHSSRRIELVTAPNAKHPARG